MITLYGIPNCDTVKKARAWLDARGLVYAFHDYKKAGVPEENLARWCDADRYLLSTSMARWYPSWPGPMTLVSPRPCPRA